MALNSDWKRPDRDKRTDEEQTLDMVLLDVIAAGIADNKADALKFVRRKVPQESYYQKKIMDDLKKRAAKEGLRAVIWKAAQGMFSRGGVSDVNALIGGVMFCVEVKRPFFGEASELQKQFVDDVNAAGGVAGVVVYADELDPLWQRAAEIRKERTR